MNKPTSDFLVLSRGKWDATASPEQIQTAIVAFCIWIDKLVAEGKMRHGQRLGVGGKTVFKKGAITDGPFGESKEIVGGYWFIHAADLDEAAKFASGNPCLNYGLYLEIRPLDPEKASAFVVTNETPKEKGGK